MCLLIPGRIVSINGSSASVDYGTQTRIGRLLETGYEVGDYVLIQGGIIIDRVEAEEAERALRSYADAVAAQQRF